MIQEGSRLVVADNSGALIVECIRVLGGTGRRFASIGDVIICAVKKAMPNGAVKKSEVVKAIIVRTRKEIKRMDGTYIRFDNNAVIIISAQGEARFTRIFGAIAKELRLKSAWSKFLSLAPEVL
jgi:large subunit ribosomal protein L14